MDVVINSSEHAITEYQQASSSKFPIAEKVCTANVSQSRTRRHGPEFSDVCGETTTGIIAQVTGVLLYAHCVEPPGMGICWPATLRYLLVRMIGTAKYQPQHMVERAQLLKLQLEDLDVGVQKRD